MLHGNLTSSDVLLYYTTVRLGPRASPILWAGVESYRLELGGGLGGGEGWAGACVSPPRSPGWLRTVDPPASASCASMPSSSWALSEHTQLSRGSGTIRLHFPGCSAVLRF